MQDTSNEPFDFFASEPVVPARHLLEYGFRQATHSNQMKPIFAVLLKGWCVWPGPFWHIRKQNHRRHPVSRIELTFAGIFWLEE